MRRARLLLALALAGLAGFAASACVTHDTDRAASTPNGALGTVVLGNAGELSPVELLAVRDSGLLFSYERRISYASFSAMRSIVFPAVAGQKTLLRAGHPPDSTLRASLAGHARFPRGLSPAGVDSLLRAYGQADLNTVRE